MSKNDRQRFFARKSPTAISNMENYGIGTQHYNWPCLCMRHRPSARTFQHVTVPIQNIYLKHFKGERITSIYVRGETTLIANRY